MDGARCFRFRRKNDAARILQAELLTFEIAARCEHFSWAGDGVLAAPPLTRTAPADRVLCCMPLPVGEGNSARLQSTVSSSPTGRGKQQCGTSTSAAWVRGSGPHAPAHRSAAANWLRLTDRAEDSTG